MQQSTCFATTWKREPWAAGSFGDVDGFQGPTDVGGFGSGGQQIRTGRMECRPGSEGRGGRARTKARMGNGWGSNAAKRFRPVSPRPGFHSIIGQGFSWVMVESWRTGH